MHLIVKEPFPAEVPCKGNSVFYSMRRRMGENGLTRTRKCFIVAGLVMALTRLNGQESGWVGSAVASLPGGVSAITFCNPAMLAAERNFIAGMRFSDPYTMKEFRSISIGMARPVPGGVIGLVFRQQGFSLYREQEAGFSYSGRWGRGLMTGARLKLFHLALGEGYGSTILPGTDIGMVVKCGKQWYSGGYISTTLDPHVSRTKLWSCQTSWGIRCNLSGMMTLSASVCKTMDDPVRPWMGLSCHNEKRTGFFASVTCLPFAFSLGACYRIQGIQCSMELAYQSPLGFTPSNMLIYSSER